MFFAGKKKGCTQVWGGLEWKRGGKKMLKNPRGRSTFINRENF